MEKRKYNKQRHDRPTLPKGSKLITCPISYITEEGKQASKEWVLNPDGKTSVCILHEYVQRALKSKPTYTYKELENTATPYMVTIKIGNIQYGKGIGGSKKVAKMEAAKAALEAIIPGMKGMLQADPAAAANSADNRQGRDLSFFDDIRIEDPRVAEFCTKTTEPLPHTILLTCLQRNFGLTELDITYKMVPLKRSKSEFTMTCGTHTATVLCINKREGKQKASQALLQLLHPHINSWGSLLRLYGTSSVQSFKEKKAEEQKITALQSKGVSHCPNYAILNKLREEMSKLNSIRRDVKPIGIFIPPENVKLPTSSAHLGNIQL